MPRPVARSKAADPEPEPASGSTDSPRPERDSVPAAAAASGASSISLADLPVAGLTRRRIGLLVGAVVAAWIIVLFARQVGEASEATGRADAMRVSNATLEADVAALTRELDTIQRQDYIEQQAREYRLGTTREIPFILADDAPPLAADAPGSAAVKLGAIVDRPTPLESWLNLLFGPASDPAGAPAGSPTGG
jgi:cell division protein FtsB